MPINREDIKVGSLLRHMPSMVQVEVLAANEGAALVRFPRGAEVSVVYTHLEPFYELAEVPTSA